jgi:hypothetical protein
MRQHLIIEAIPAQVTPVATKVPEIAAQIAPVAADVRPIPRDIGAARTVSQIARDIGAVARNVAPILAHIPAVAENVPAIGANVAIVTAAPIPVAALSRSCGRDQCRSENCGGGESKHDFTSHGALLLANGCGGIAASGFKTKSLAFLLARFEPALSGAFRRNLSM